MAAIFCEAEILVSWSSEHINTGLGKNAAATNSLSSDVLSIAGDNVINYGLGVLHRSLDPRP